MMGKKRLAHDVFDTFVTRSDLVRGVTDPCCGHKMAAPTVMFLRGSVFLGGCTSSLEGSAGAGSQQQGLCVNKSGASSDFSACVKLKM